MEGIEDVLWIDDLPELGDSSEETIEQEKKMEQKKWMGRMTPPPRMLSPLPPTPPESPGPTVPWRLIPIDLPPCMKVKIPLNRLGPLQEWAQAKADERYGIRQARTKVEINWRLRQRRRRFRLRTSNGATVRLLRDAEGNVTEGGLRRLYK